LTTSLLLQQLPEEIPDEAAPTSLHLSFCYLKPNSSVPACRTQEHPERLLRVFPIWLLSNNSVAYLSQRIKKRRYVFL